MSPGKPSLERFVPGVGHFFVAEDAVPDAVAECFNDAGGRTKIHIRYPKRNDIRVGRIPLVGTGAPTLCRFVEVECLHAEFPLLR